jgi:putative CocE/NonD family hydrolase
MNVDFKSGLLTKLFASIFLFVLMPVLATAQQLSFESAATVDELESSKTSQLLAKEAIALYKDDDRAAYLNNLYRLQIIAGQYSEANKTIEAYRDLFKATNSFLAASTFAHELFSDAKLIQTDKSLSFEDAFRQSFRDIFGKLNDKDAFQASWYFVFNLARTKNNLQSLLDKQKDKKFIELKDAIELLRTFETYQVYKNILPLTESLTREDDEKRYIIQNDLLITTQDGAKISAVVVRPKSAAAPLPTALEFTIYADKNNNLYSAKQSAAYGYAGVLALTRGKGLSPDEIVPYEYEAKDTYSVIDWISKQSWSNGKVGMFGGSYDGFTCWAAAKSAHPALKTIVPYVANNPGDGLPMENNIFLFVNYAWAFYVTNNKYLDNDTYFDNNRWNSLNDKWYQSGKSYREIDSADGTPNKWLQRWLQHPAYDKYWQSLVPYKNEFAKINIPVLTITGYYDDGQQSALRFLKEHYKYNKNAEHYLLIGPYDHFGAQTARKSEVLRNYAIDPVAQMNTTDITYQWLDYVLRGGKKPDLIKDKINYEVMGANEWKHAPSLEKMSNQFLTLYLTDQKTDNYYRLSSTKPSKAGFLEQTVDFADRKTTNNDYYPDLIVGKKPDLTNGFAFISEPINEPLTVNGTFEGVIKAVINKKDMDIGIVLYEVMPDGELFHLSYFLGRASYSRDLSVRKLLTPGKIESIPFYKTRLVSRQISKGSRLLITLNVNKNQFAQINYGTGKDVSDENISDAKIPLIVKWLNDSFVKIPVWK